MHFTRWPKQPDIRLSGEMLFATNNPKIRSDSISSRLLKSVEVIPKGSWNLQETNEDENLNAKAEEVIYGHGRMLKNHGG